MLMTSPARFRQRGASLVVALVILAMLMIMGIAGYVASTTQFRMAANLQFLNIAMANAESALATGESWLAANYNNPGLSVRSPGGLYPQGTAPDPFTMTWDDTTSVRVDVDGRQRFMIELLVSGRPLPSNSAGMCNPYGTSGPCPTVNVYRLTTRGTSILGTVKHVQSVYSVRVNI